MVMNRIKDYNKLAIDIVAWIRQYAIDNNIQSLIVGKSGGIDSAVTTTLCAMTGLTTCCMSIEICNEISPLAQMHIDWLKETYPDNVLSSSCNLTSVFEQFLEHTPDTLSNDLVIANSKSRMRMMALYQMAGMLNGIVVGTGNKVEDFGIGFFTKYGDGGVDISPIADLYKTEVRELGRHLGIAQEIIDAAPTDGLFADGRTDEDQIGCTYEELESIMDKGYYYNNDRKICMRGGKPLEGRELEVAIIYNKLNRKNQHKMLPVPIFKLNQ